jgi:hypothetical protein
MNHGDEQIETPGPFEVRFDAAQCFSATSSQEGIPEAFNTSAACDEPKRVHDCANYDRCLELAAALNWESFTCEGCCGEVNDTLTWRAGQVARKDSVAKAICGAPKISTFVGLGSKAKKAENS